MICEDCGKEMIKIGELTDTEKKDFYYMNECINTSSQALNTDVLKEVEFSDGQVFEYFRAAFDAIAKARFFQFMFYRDLRKRLNVEADIFVDTISCEVFIHPIEK